jgi:dihydrofolate reductase
MRKVVALVFNYSLNGLLADEGTDYYKFCFELLDQQGGADRDDGTLDLLRSAHAHLMGRTAYEGMSRALPGSDHPWANILNSGRKVVLSRTMKTADWPNTTIVAGDTSAEIDNLRQGGDGHILAWGGVVLALAHAARHTDELHVSMQPYIADEGTRLFDDVPHLPARPGLHRQEHRGSSCTTGGTAQWCVHDP